MNSSDFPPLTWNNRWEGSIQLPEWAGFFVKTDSDSSGNASDGNVSLLLLSSDETKPASDEQKAAFAYLMQHGAEIQNVILQRLFEIYPELQQQYGYVGAEIESFMPNVSSPQDFKSLIRLYAVHIHSVAKEGVAYAGFSFGCTWDDEHDLGVLMHQNRVVEVGGADTSFLSWIAERDGGMGISEALP